MGARTPGVVVAGDVDLTVTCTPMVHPDQRVSLLLGDREIVAPPRTSVRSVISFRVEDLRTGEYVVRLRVDGVDSLPIDRRSATPAFADHQLRVAKQVGGTVTVTTVESLTESDRVVELSRMLSGSPGSSTAQEHASELLEAAARVRGR